jgi:peroxiredoxin
MAEIPPALLPPRPLRGEGGARQDGSVTGDYTELPADLPVPVDDGAAVGLAGREVPDLPLPATTEPRSPDADADGPAGLRLADLANGLLVAYVYPMTGTPGRALPHGWDDIPGARGCTPQNCAYRDALADFEGLGASVVGISAQSPAEQAEFAAREHIPFPLLSDEGLRLRDALGLPTFEVEGRTLYRRLTFVAAEGRIVKVFYPVFPPDRDAAEVLAWLRDRVAEAEEA